MSQGDETPEIRKARAALFRAEAEKEVAWTTARHAYEHKSALSFVDALGRDKAYLDTWETEQQRYDTYKSLQSPEMDDLLRQLDIMKSANDRLSYKIKFVLPFTLLHFRHD
jgi:hypothetical protein